MYKYSLNLFLSILLSLNYLHAEFDYVTVPAGADPTISAEDGGNGFEEIAESLGYQTANFTDDDLIYFGDSKAIKWDTQTSCAQNTIGTHVILCARKHLIQNK